MVFDAADIGDRDVRRGRDIINDAAEPGLDLSVAAPRPRGKALAKHFPRSSDQNHRDVGIAAAYRVNHGARKIRDHRAPGADVIIDRPRQCVAMAVRLPMQSEIAPRARLPEGIEGYLHIILGSGCFPRHHAAGKNDVAVIGAGAPRQPEQGILAGPARTDHHNEPARSDRGRPTTGYRRRFRHATRRRRCCIERRCPP